MNVDITMISVPIGGAIIGYITNWLAIKMLFKPHHEKRVFGIKIPFTPGLIPKERERIAKAIGEVVGNYLLTNDVIVNELTSDKMDDEIVKYVEDFLFEENNKINLKKLSNQILGTNLVNSQINSYIVNKLVMVAEDQEFIDILSIKLSEEFQNIMKTVKVNEHKEFLDKLIRQLTTSDETKNFLKGKLLDSFDRDSKISDILGDNIITNINGAIAFNEPNIKNGIKDILQKEEVATGVKEMISGVMESKLGALGAMFVNPDSIYETIVSSVDEKLESIEVSRHINSYVNDLFEKQVFEVLPENITEGIVNEIIAKLTNEAFVGDISKSITDSEIDIMELVNKVTDDNALEIIRDFIKKQIVNLDRLKIRQNIEEVVNRIIFSIEETPIELTEHQKHDFDGKVIEGYKKLVSENVPKIVKNTKVIKLVENQINSFEIDMLEKIILDIAKKELSAITWLGALLGFVMSLVILLIR